MHDVFRPTKRLTLTDFLQAPLLFQVRVLGQIGKAQLIRAEPSAATGCLVNRGVSMLLLFHRQFQTAMQGRDAS